MLKGTDDRALRDKRLRRARLHRLRRRGAAERRLRPGGRQDVSRGHDASAANRVPRLDRRPATRSSSASTMPRKRDTPADATAGDAPPAGDEAPRPPAGGPADAANAAGRRGAGRPRALALAGLAAAVAAAGAGSSATATFSYLAEYRVEAKKFIRLADEDVRTVTVGAEAALGDRHRRPRVRADGQSRRPALPGRLRHRHDDRRAQAGAQAGALVQRPVARRPVVPLLRGRQLPRLLDGRPGRRATSRQGAPASFVDVEDDHNVVKPPTGVDRLGERQRVGAAAPTTGTSGRCRSPAARPST